VKFYGALSCLKQQQWCDDVGRGVRSERERDSTERVSEIEREKEQCAPKKTLPDVQRWS